MSYKHEDMAFFLWIAGVLCAIIFWLAFLGYQLYGIHAEYECRNLGLVANVGIFEYRCTESAY